MEKGGEKRWRYIFKPVYFWIFECEKRARSFRDVSAQEILSRLRAYRTTGGFSFSPRASHSKIFHCHYRPSARQFITRRITKRYFISMRRATHPWPAAVDTHFCSGRLQITIPGGCRRRRRRHRRRCRRRRRRWQIINIHYVLTKLSHKLRARGKNGIVDNGWADEYGSLLDRKM